MAHPDRFYLACVMGWPIAHSRSPLLHNYWFRRHGLAGTYVPVAVKPEGLAAALRALPALGFVGCNLTLPLKQHAMAIVDEVDEVARHIGAISCVTVRPDGSLAGTNNDCYGFVQNLKQAAPDWRADAGPAVVLGAGGGSRAVCYALLQEGATEIRLVNRTPARAQGIADDIIYAPLETPFLAAARSRGNRTVNGLGMLLHQGRPAWKGWFGIDTEVTAELRELMERSLDRE